MILPLAVVAQLAAACTSLVAPDTLVAVAKTESGLDPLAIGDNTAHRSFSPRDTNDAIAIARDLISEGHNLDLGLMQVNWHNFAWLGLTVENAFEPCRSLAAGAVWLSSISRYNTGSPRAGFANGYVARVIMSMKGGNQRTDMPKAAEPAVPEAAHVQWNPFIEPASTPLELTFRKR